MVRNVESLMAAKRRAATPLPTQLHYRLQTLLWKTKITFACCWNEDRIELETVDAERQIGNQSLLKVGQPAGGGTTLYDSITTDGVVIANCAHLPFIFVFIASPMKSDIIQTKYSACWPTVTAKGVD